MGLYFGIDGGGTRSRMRVVTDKGDTLCRLEGESTNIYSVGKDAAFEHLRWLILRACEMGGITPDVLTAGCIGTAGLDRAGERSSFAAFFQSLLGERCPVKLCNDGEILLVGGLRRMEGYCLIGGTGSLAIARQADGQMVRAGGLGYMLGDEGSACWIGWNAVKRTLRSTEGRDLPTQMEARLLEHFKLKIPGDFVAYMHQRFSKPDVADAAKLVTALAAQGDPLAMDICEKAAGELLLLVQSVFNRMPLPQPALVFSGGVLEHDGFIRQRVTALLRQSLPAIALDQQGGTAEEGAVMLALHAVGLNTPVKS